MRRGTGLLVVVLLALPLTASAKSELFESSADKPFDVQLVGGIGGWFGNVSGVTSDLGPAYGVLGAFNKSNFFALEVGYVGHTNGVDTTDRRLASNKIQADIKAGLPMQIWRPYLFGGVAVDFVSTGTEAFGLNSGPQAVLPLGVGADFLMNKPIHVGARGTYDFAPGIGGTILPTDAHPNAWQAFLQASASF